MAMRSLVVDAFGLSPDNEYIGEGGLPNHFFIY